MITTDRTNNWIPIHTATCDKCKVHYKHPHALLKSELVTAIEQLQWVLMFERQVHVCKSCVDACGYTDFSSQGQ